MDTSKLNGEVSPSVASMATSSSATASASTSSSIEDDESASIKLGLSQLPADVTVELYQCPVCRLNDAGKETLFAVEAKLTTHLDAHVGRGDIVRHHIIGEGEDSTPCQRPCLDESGERILCDRWFMVQLFSNGTGYGKLKWRARQAVLAAVTEGTVTAEATSPSKSTFSVTISPGPSDAKQQTVQQRQQQLQSQPPPPPLQLPSSSSSSNSEDTNDQDKNISLDWPHQETAVHADSLWNDELSQLEKDVVEEILHGGAGVGGGSSASSAGFNLLGNGFPNNVDDDFGTVISMPAANERRPSGNQSQSSSSSSLSNRKASVSENSAANQSRSDLIGTLNFASPLISGGETNSLAKNTSSSCSSSLSTRHSIAATTVSTPNTRKNFASISSASASTTPLDTTTRTSARSRPGSTFKCSIHKGQCACWKHEKNYRGANNANVEATPPAKDGGHEYSKSSKQKKKTGKAGVVPDPGIALNPSTSGIKSNHVTPSTKKKSTLDESSPARSRKSDLLETMMTIIENPSTSSSSTPSSTTHVTVPSSDPSNLTASPENEPPDHCYAMSVPAVEDPLTLVVGMDHNYCAVPASTVSPTSGRHRSGSSISLPQSSPVKSEPTSVGMSLNNQEAAEEEQTTVEASSSKKRKSSASSSSVKKRGRKKKEKPDLDSIDDAIRNVVSSVSDLPMTSRIKEEVTVAHNLDPMLEVKKEECLVAGREKKELTEDIVMKNLIASSLSKEEIGREGNDKVTKVGVASVCPPPLLDDEDSTDTSIAIDEDLEKEREALLKTELEETEAEEKIRSPSGGNNPVAAKEAFVVAENSVNAASEDAVKGRAATNAEEEVGDANRRRSSRWSNLPKAAKRKRMKKFEAILKAEKSKSGYLGMQADSEDDSDAERKPKLAVESVSKRKSSSLMPNKKAAEELTAVPSSTSVDAKVEFQEFVDVIHEKKEEWKKENDEEVKMASNQPPQPKLSAAQNNQSKMSGQARVPPTLRHNAYHTQSAYAPHKNQPRTSDGKFSSSGPIVVVSLDDLKTERDRLREETKLTVKEDDGDLKVVDDDETDHGTSSDVICDEDEREFDARPKRYEEMTAIRPINKAEVNLRHGFPSMGVERIPRKPQRRPLFAVPTLSLVIADNASQNDPTQTQKMVAELTKMGLLQPGKSITVNELKKRRGMKRKIGSSGEPSAASNGASMSKKIRLISTTLPKLSLREKEKSKVVIGSGATNRVVSLLHPIISKSAEKSPHHQLHHQTRCYFCCKDSPTHSCASVKEQLFNERLLAVCPRLAKESTNEADLVCKCCLDLLVKLEDTFYEMGDRRMKPEEVDLEGDADVPDVTDDSPIDDEKLRVAMEGEQCSDTRHSAKDQAAHGLLSSDSINESSADEMREFKIEEEASSDLVVDEGEGDMTTGAGDKVENGDSDKMEEGDKESPDKVSTTLDESTRDKVTNLIASFSPRRKRRSTDEMHKGSSDFLLGSTSPPKATHEPTPSSDLENKLLVSAPPTESADKVRAEPTNEDSVPPSTASASHLLHVVQSLPDDASSTIEAEDVTASVEHAIAAVVSGSSISSLITSEDGPSVLNNQPVQFLPSTEANSTSQQSTSTPPSQSDNPKPSHLYLSHKFIVGYFIFNYLEHLVRLFCKEKGISNVDQARERIRRILDRYQTMNASMQQHRSSHHQTASKIKMSVFLSCQVDVGLADPANAASASRPNPSSTAANAATSSPSLEDEEDEDPLTRVKRQVNYLSRRNAMILRTRAEDMKRYQSEVVTIMRRCVKDAKDTSIDQKMLANYAVRANSTFKALLNLYKTDIRVLKTVSEEALANPKRGECFDPSICPYKDALEEVKFDIGRSLATIASHNGPFSLLAECLELMSRNVESTITASSDTEEQRILVDEAETDSTSACEIPASSISMNHTDIANSQDQQSSLQETLIDTMKEKTIPSTDGLNLLCAAMEGDLK